MIGRFFLQDLGKGQFNIWQVVSVFEFYGKLTVQCDLVANDLHPVVDQFPPMATAKFRVSTVAEKFIPVN